MADSTSNSYVQSDTFGLRQIGSSFFGIPGFLVELSSKGSSDSNSAWSPTSPLDFRGFVNLSNPFSARSPKCSSQNCLKKKWNCSKVGLGIVNSLAEENKAADDVLDSLKRKNIVFGPQVKISTRNSSGNYNESVNTFMKSNSLPRNYVVPPILLTKTPSLQLGSSPVVIDRGSQVETFSGSKSSSLPIPIGTGQGYAGSLYARQIELSEDYTCIISHGPNPRTTHIFGDCVLECPVHELANFDKQGVKTPQVAKRPECLSPYPFEDFSSFCYSCKKKLEKGADIYMYRGEKAFCNFDCRDEEILAEEKEEKCNNSSKSSPGSRYNEDFFIMGLPPSPHNGL